MKIFAISAHAIIGLLLALPNEGSSLKHDHARKNSATTRDIDHRSGKAGPSIHDRLQGRLKDRLRGGDGDDNFFPKDSVQGGRHGRRDHHVDVDPPRRRDGKQGLYPFNEEAMTANGITPAHTTVSSPPRDLQNAVDSCEDSTMIEIPPGETIIAVQASNDLGAVDPSFPCFIDSEASIASFIVVGTGNPMYATTCSAEITDFEPAALRVATIGTAAQGCSIAGAERDDCPSLDYSSSCPFNDRYAPALSWDSEEGVLYQIVIVGFSGEVGNFTLTIGEDIGNPPANDACPAAIPLELNNAIVSVDGNSDGAGMERDIGCWDSVFSALWYSIRGNGKRFTASTCSEKTTFQSNVAVLSSNADDSQVACEFHMECVETTSFSDPPCEFGSRGTVSWLTEPDELYFIQVASRSIGFAGTFELSVTESEPTPMDECDIGADLHYNTNFDSDCSCQDFGDSAELVCINYCIHCDTTGATCINSTEVTTFLGAQETNYKINIQQSEGRNELIEHEVMNDGTCMVSVDGIQCASCTVQPCGAPMLDCSNIDQRLDSVDMCSIDAVVSISNSKADVTTSALYGLVSSEFPTCTFIPSTVACDAALADSALNSDISCTCEYYSYAAEMMCTSTCGLSCNDDETVCYTEESSIQFDFYGAVRRTETEIEYAIGNEGASFTLYEYSDSSCDVYTNGGPSSDSNWSCNCEVVLCDDGTSLPSLSCSDWNSDAVFDYNYCTPSIIDDGIFFALSSEGINECIDLSPANDLCTAATPVAIDELILTSTFLASESQYDACLEEEEAGLWFTFVGTGSLLQLSPCSMGDQFDTRINIQKGDCDALECLLTTSDCETIAWYAEEGVTYRMHMHQPWYSGASFVHDFKVEAATQGLQNCFQDGAARKDASCQCYFYTPSDISEMIEFEQYCESTCEEKCNSQGTSCGSVGYESSTFDETGQKIRAYSRFEYHAMESGLDGSVYSEFNSEDSMCEGGFLDLDFESTQCTSCQMANCPDSDLVAPLLDCSNFVDGGIYHLCGDVSIESGSRFEIWDGGEFQQCLTNGTVAPTSVPTSAPTGVPTAAPSNVPLAGGDAPSVPAGDTSSTEMPGTTAPTASSAWRMQSGVYGFLVATCFTGVFIFTM